MQWQSEPRWFVIAGAQRCGTTRLCAILDAHPDIQMARPFIPEPKLFLRDNSIEARECLTRQLFAEPARPIIRGEKSTSYMETPGVAERLDTCLPGVRIVFVLRHPATRALSNYFYSVAHGLETRSLEEVFLLQREAPVPTYQTSIPPFNYLGRSNYLEYLEKYSRVVGRDRMHVLLTEEFVECGGWLTSLLNFLGVDSALELPIPSTRINACSPMGVKVDHVIEVLVEYFRQQIQDLECFLGRDLSAWKSPTFPGLKAVMSRNVPGGDNGMV